MGRARAGVGRAAVVLLGVAVLAGPALLTAPSAAVRAAGPAGPSVTPDGSTTVIEADARTISLRQWFSAVDVGTDSQSDNTFTWTAPSTTDELDVVVFGGGGGGGGGKGGNHGNTTSPDIRGAGGGGGGGGEARRLDDLAVTPGETLDARAGAGGTFGAGAGNANFLTAPYTAAQSGGAGSASFLQRGGVDLLLANGGTGGTGGNNPGIGGTGGTGGSGGSGGTLLTAGIDGVDGVPDSAPASAATGLDNSGADWLFNGLRLGLGGGGGGGKSSNGGAVDALGPGTTATTAAVHDLDDLTSTITRVGGDGDGGNNRYLAAVSKHAPAHLGGGGGGGAYVFSGGRNAGRGASGGVILHYAVADLIVSEVTPTDASIPVTTGSTDVTLQLRDALGTATNISVGPIVFTVAGTDATLGTVTDNDDGTYTATLTAGATAGTATVTATVVGSDFTDTAVVTVVAPAAAAGGATPVVSCAPDPVAPGGTVACDVTGGDPDVEILWRADRGDGTDPVASTGVTLDATGAGRFSFTAPLAPVPATLRVALVGWGADVVLGVTADGAAVAPGDEPLPSAIRAGGVPSTTTARWTPVWTALGGGLAAGLLATRRRLGSRR